VTGRINLAGSAFHKRRSTIPQQRAGMCSSCPVHMRLMLTSTSKSYSFAHFDSKERLFQVHEVNMGYFGITIMNPSVLTEFSNNIIRTLHTHAAAHIGVQIGESENNAARIHSNKIAVRTSTDSTRGEAALQSGVTSTRSICLHSTAVLVFALEPSLNQDQTITRFPTARSKLKRLL
jgi:hypothetical protein